MHTKIFYPIHGRRGCAGLNKGIAYLEAIIAAAVLSAVFIPAISVYYAASLNQNYAVKFYKAATQAELAASAARRSYESLGAPAAGIFAADYLNEDHLLHDEFDFNISIYTESEIHSAGFENDNADIVIYDEAPEFFILSAPEISFNDTQDWVMHGDLSRELFLNGGERLFLEFADHDEFVSSGSYMITADVYDKNGEFLIRAVLVIL